ncbi:MAG: flagellar biosynthesis regulator FlaF [Sphingomonadales bacterium]|nr:flagellar biosynthesis regulator FlaF [Sphingomonadales bacterium]
MSLNAYQQAQNVGKDAPQDTEHRLFMEVTASLIKVQTENDKGQAFFKALDWNRRLWSTLSTDCAVEGNGLPKELRAGIVSIGLWVSKYSSQVARGNDDIAALIDINKTIMEGLVQQKERMAEQQKLAMKAQAQAQSQAQSSQSHSQSSPAQPGKPTNIEA